MATNKQIEQKIEERVYRDSHNGCWIWMGALDQNGRPKINIDERRFGGKMITVLPHIYLYEKEFGEVEARYFDNRCGNPRCVSPEHNRPRTLAERMDNYVEDGNGCWIWQGNTLGNGYGRITINKKTYSTHRVSYELHKGEIPDGLMVLHDCDNKLCINPDHLHLGTHAMNMREAVESRLMPRGEDNGNSVLTEEKVIEIKQLIQSRMITYRQIAERFGVSRSAIKDIAAGRTWAWV